MSKKVFSRFPKNDEIYKKKNHPTFFNILKEPLVVQTQTLHLQKAHDLGYWEQEEKGCGIIRRTPRPLAAKAYFVEFYGRVFGF